MDTINSLDHARIVYVQIRNYIILIFFGELYLYVKCCTIYWYHQSYYFCFLNIFKIRFFRVLNIDKNLLINYNKYNIL